MAKQFISCCWRPSHGKSIKQSPAKQSKKQKGKWIKNCKKEQQTGDSCERRNMKNDADFNDACCQRAAVTPRLAPPATGGQDENRQETEKTCLLFRADLFAFALLRRQQKEKQKIQFKIIAALCLLHGSNMCLLFCLCRCCCCSCGPKNMLIILKGTRRNGLARRMIICCQQHVQSSCTPLASGSLKV